MNKQSSLAARADTLRTIREFFYPRQVIEVETPGLSQAANTDPYIESFAIDTLSTPRYLHTSPEYPMKRLLAQGSGDIYQICKVWRNEPASQRHNPEFTLLEYYRCGFDEQQLMHEVDELLLALLPALHRSSHFISYHQLFLDNCGINPHTSDIGAVDDCVANYVPRFSGELDRQGKLDLLLSHHIEMQLPGDRLTYVYDYPVTQSALAQTAYDSVSGSHVAKRFEVFCGALELANGYRELTEASSNRAVLTSELAQRKAQGLHEVPVDERFLAAIAQNLPDCAGIAIGIDRVLMIRQQAKSIDDVINFCWQDA